MQIKKTGEYIDVVRREQKSYSSTRWTLEEAKEIRDKLNKMELG